MDVLREESLDILDEGGSKYLTIRVSVFLRQLEQIIKQSFKCHQPIKSSFDMERLL